MQGMDAEARGELQRLRARAYGPDADLADDPAAWARLRDLEEAERRGRADATPPPVEESAPAPADDEAQDIDADRGDDAVTDRPSRRPVLRRARTLWLWAGSLAVVAAVASAASIAATTFVPVARTAGVAQVDALRPDPTVATDVVRSMGFGSSPVSGYADFYGLTAFAGSTEIDSAGNRADCLLLMDTADIGATGDDTSFRGGFRYGACGAGAFPATVEFVVTPELPEAFRQRFPVGSSVQFVREGERVGVFSDAE